MNAQPNIRWVRVQGILPTHNKFTVYAVIFGDEYNEYKPWPVHEEDLNTVTLAWIRDGRRPQ